MCLQVVNKKINPLRAVQKDAYFCAVVNLQNSKSFVDYSTLDIADD